MSLSQFFLASSFFFGVFFTFYFFPTLSVTPGRITISISNTSIWWNDTISVNGTASYLNGTTINNSNTIVSINNVTTCTTTTNATGGYNCTFNGPLFLGTLNLRVEVVAAGNEIVENTSTLHIKATYGPRPAGFVDRVVYEVPMLMQEPNGNITKVTASLLVWRG